ncbi:flagellar filament capping protein FliD [Pseudoalteromonas piratica]|uniref:Flagellar hook-associated protein 2 n=1 Tax=Pseudoalteromonas piratica TaxID=1348114 RepID=A0A0A7EE69_9GAMM|nr:flagellar filament capping protein FliD [Pseudoalteromonas piratica]AIY64945.1 flagellar cap protein [Pseudoalteromonas piratica]
MASITSAGVGSGLDLESIIKASLDAENIPKLQAFATKEESLQKELSSIDTISSAISQLESTVKKLSDIDNFNKRTASITQPSSGDIIGVTTTKNSTAGNFNIEVVQLAQGSRAVSNTGFTASTDVVTATGGTLTFSAGSSSFDVVLDAGATLEDVRNAINDENSNFGVIANIINTGSESKLVLTSNKTGTGNDLVVSNNTAELDAVSTVANGGGAGGLAIAASDQATDAIIKVDGITVTNDSNTFTDAVQDMTITAKKVSENNETARINVDYDKASVNTLIDEFIANYNNLIGNIGFQTRIGNPLNGDASMRSLDNQLTSILGTNLTGLEPFGTIFDIGLGIDKDGYLEKSTLVRSVNDSLDNYYDKVGEAFAGDNGIAKQFQGLIDNYIDSKGIIKERSSSLNQQLDDMEEDILNHEYRMEQLEIRLRKQYSSLDVLLAEMQSTQSYLSAQLASLPGFTSAKK